MPSEPIAATTPATEAGFYTHWWRETIRQNDTDRQGHVNNALIATYFEIGRFGMFDEQTFALVEREAGIVLRKLTVEFLRELHFPGAVDVGSRGVRLGTSSFTLAQGIFRDGACIATADAVCVLVGRESRRPQAMSAALRERLTRNWRL